MLVRLRGGVAPLPEVPHPAYQSWVASACGTSLVTSLWRSARTGDAQQFKKRERSASRALTPQRTKKATKNA